MRVKCIAISWSRNGIKEEGPKHGDICHVTKEEMDGILYYYLLEWPPYPIKTRWDSKGFEHITQPFQVITFEKVLEKELTSVN